MHRTAPELTVDYLTCLGKDPFSTRILDFISGQGLGTSAIQQIQGKKPGLYAINTTSEGERSFTYWRSDSAARHLFGDGNFGILTEYDAVYLSGISVAILPHPVRIALLDWLNKSSITVIYDSNYRPGLWDSVDHARQITTDFWHRADVALPSIDDEMALFNETADQVTARFGNIKSKGALKRGHIGPLSLGAHVHQNYPAASNVIDTTAAGDSFNGGYLGALLSGQSQKDALMAGHNWALAVVQHRGAIIPE
jgi:2-dehydro-3-deoxygluconokinase